MPNKKNRSKRGSRSNRSAVVTALSPSEVFERELSVRKDQAVLKGKQIVVFPLTSGVQGGLPLSTAAFGARVLALTSCYMRWKILKLIIRPLTNLVDPYNSLVVGMIDDPTYIPLSTNSSIIDLRCSRVLGNSGTDSNEFYWNPVDPDKWYYTSIPPTGPADQRFESPVALAAIATPSSVSTLPVCFYYTIMVEGAADPGVT